MRLFHAFLLTLGLLTFSCKAQKKEKEEPSQEKASSSLEMPDGPVGYVSDFEQLFTTSQIEYLDSMLSAHEKETTNQLAIVTFPLDTTQIKTDDQFKTFSLALFKKWGPGTKEKNNGIGILLSFSLRKIRIETGKGLNEKLTDEEAHDIINNIMLPYFKKGDYFNGMIKGVEAIIEEIK